MSAILDARCRACGTSYRFDPDKPYPPSPTCHACLYAQFTAQAAEIERLRMGLENIAQYATNTAAPGVLTKAQMIGNLHAINRACANALLRTPQAEPAPDARRRACGWAGNWGLQLDERCGKIKPQVRRAGGPQIAILSKQKYRSKKTSFVVFDVAFGKVVLPARYTKKPC